MHCVYFGFQSIPKKQLFVISTSSYMYITVNVNLVSYHCVLLAIPGENDIKASPRLSGDRVSVTVIQELPPGTNQALLPTQDREYVYTLSTTGKTKLASYIRAKYTCSFS